MYTTGNSVAELQLIPQNVNAELTALINDTTGTLIASNYVDPNTKIAVIFGTGCNAAYMETAGNIPKMSSVGLEADQGMAINVRS
jgi:hexokinase